MKKCMEQNKYKILVTGANGYLGRGIVSKLIDLNQEVIAVDFSTEKIDTRAQRIQADIFSLENPYEYFQKPDIVLHCAWRDGFIHDSMNHILDLPKHYSFLEKLVSSGLKKIAVLGTMHEIGYHGGVINNDTECHPLSLYGISKNALRQSLTVLQNKIQFQFIWLRAFYIVSNDASGNSIFSKLIQANNNYSKVKFPFNSGLNQYDFLDYDDFVYYVSHAILQKDYVGIINIASGYPQTLKERVIKFISHYSLNIELDFGVYPDRDYDSKCVYGDNEIIMDIIKKKT